MRYTGIQPQYFPRLHYFARVLKTDIFVLREDVQFVRKHKYPNEKTGSSYQANTPIKREQGEYLLPVAIQHAGYQSISQVLLAKQIAWQAEHKKILRLAYEKAPYFTAIFPQIEMLLDQKYASLADLNIATFCWGLLLLLGVDKPSFDKITISSVVSLLSQKPEIRLKDIRKASTLKASEDPPIQKNEKIIAIIKAVGADEDYCGGTAVAAYMDDELFTKNGITITTQNWQCPKYPQQFVKQHGFIPNLSIIDLLMNVSRADALTLLTKE